jgi:hypothetical protein
VPNEDVRIFRGTPRSPLQRPALFLRLWRSAAPGEEPRMMATLTMARRTHDGYVIKNLIADMELEPKAAVEKAVAIARRGDVGEVYVNPDVSKLPGGEATRAL